MPARVEFFSAPYSRPNRHFPIGSLTKYLVHSEMLMKTSPDMEQIVNVPEFPDWDIVNLVRITDTSYVYWVKASYKRTDLKGQVTFELLFNPVTSLITEGDVLNGVWDRLPTNESRYLKEVINTDAMEIFRTEPLPKLPFFMSQIFWYEIVLKQEIDKTSGQCLTRYGGFALGPFNSTNNSEEFVVCDVVTSPSRFRGYPSFHRIMNDFASIATNASTDKIVSINVSVRCPYEWIQTSGSGDARIDLVNRNNHKIKPKIYKDTGLPAGADWVLYELETTEDDSPVPWSENMTITLTENELKYGAVNIIDESGIIINEIPNELFINGWMQVHVTTVSDYTGIYTDLEFLYNRIRIPEGKLPWVGDGWSEYQVRSMATDRESLELSINNAREQRNIDAIMSLSNAGMSSAMGFAMGGPIGAAGLGLLTAGTGIVGSHLQGQLSERTAKAEQEIREKHQKHQLSNNYETAYGMIYLLDNNFKSLMIATSMPANLNPQTIDDHVKEFGYRTEGVKSVTVQEGRYQGRLIDIPISGPKGDLLNAEFIEGVHLTMEDGS